MENNYRINHRLTKQKYDFYKTNCYRDLYIYVKNIIFQTHVATVHCWRVAVYWWSASLYHTETDRLKPSKYNSWSVSCNEKYMLIILMMISIVPWHDLILWLPNKIFRNYHLTPNKMFGFSSLASNKMFGFSLLDPNKIWPSTFPPTTDHMILFSEKSIGPM